MKKEDCLKSLENIIKFQKNQMKNIYLVIYTNKSDTELTSKSHFECQIGKWLYSSHAKEIFGPQTFEKLEQKHIEWHKIYQKIYDMLFSNKKGLLLKIFSKSKLSPMDEDRVKAYYDELENISNEFLQIIESAKKRVNAMSESKFTKL